MRGAERIVFAFCALGETGKTARLTQRADAVAAARQNLVRIGLVTNVPDQPIPRRIEEIVQSDRQLDDAEPGAQVAARLRNGVDQFGAKFRPRAAEVRFRTAALDHPV